MNEEHTVTTVTYFSQNEKKTNQNDNIKMLLSFVFANFPKIFVL